MSFKTPCELKNATLMRAWAMSIVSSNYRAPVDDNLKFKYFFDVYLNY